MADYLHGIRTIFMTDADPIELLDASIIGVIGTGEGADETMFPLNTPVLVNNVSMLTSIGTGTLRTAVLKMWKQSACLSVVIRIEDDADPDVLKANYIGALDNDTGLMTGMQAFLRSEKEAGKRPRILIAPDIQDLDIAKALQSVGLKYNAIPIVESTGTGFATNSAFKTELDTAYVLVGGERYFDTEATAYVDAGGSATMAGIIVRTDNEKSFAKSPSNEFAYELKSPAQDIDYTPGSLTCLANVYNSEQMGVFTNMTGGVKLWGSRLANGDMIQKERVRLIIADSIRLETQDIIDENITKIFIDNIVGRVQNFIDRMALDGIISGGKCWVPSEINIANIGLDKFYLDYSIGYYDSAEQVTYRQYVDNSFNEGLFS